MSYIGNAKTPLLLSTNVRDDLIPDGSTDVFVLSQEVPGGYEGNVVVVRRRFLEDVLIENSNLIKLEIVNQNPVITITDDFLAAAFSIVRPHTSSNNDDGDYIQITYTSAAGDKTELLRVESSVYNRDSIVINLKAPSTNPRAISEGTSVLKISRKYYDSWEILDGDTGSTKSQYEILSSAGYTNQKIKIKDFVPQVDDIIYVLHRGEATYNFVPSPSSVGPDQLSPNLRDFLVDRATYTTQGAQNLNLSRVVPSNSSGVPSDRSLIVTVNGVIQVSKEEDPVDGLWTLNPASGTSQSITLDASLFTSASVANPVKVRVLHLSFTTVTRRAAFAPGQQPTQIEDYAVTSIKLATDSVTTDKIRDLSVTGSKILLNSGEWLSSKTSSGSQHGVVTLNGVDEALVSSPVGIGFNVGTQTQRVLSIQPTSLIPASQNTFSLGSSSAKFKELHLTTGNIDSLNVNSILVSGNITITGTIDNTDVSVLRDRVDNLEANLELVRQRAIPVGTILLWSSASPPPSQSYGGEWVVCDGRELLKSSYPDLYAILGGDVRPWLWGSIRTLTTAGVSDVAFTIPDLRRRVPFGKGTSDSLGTSESISNQASRSLSHTHTGASHTHNIAHTHSIPPHKHDLSKSNIVISSSGGHTTDISHGHAAATTGAPSTTLDHAHTVNYPGESGKRTGQGGVSHTHSGTTLPGTPHGHTIEGHGTTTAGDGKNTGNSTNKFAKARTERVSGTGDTNGVVLDESSHTHRFDTGDASAINHDHPFSVSAWNGSTTSPNAAGNSLSHTHTVTIPTETITSPYGGQHTHSSSDFSGYIGEPSGADGNTTLLTNSMSTSVSGDAIYSTNVSGATTLPHLTVNFIIKVKA